MYIYIYMYFWPKFKYTLFLQEQFNKNTSVIYDKTLRTRFL